MHTNYFDGETYNSVLDGVRLATRLYQVYNLMWDEQWRTLEEISTAIGGVPEAGISARLRDLRKERFGSFQVDRRRRGNPKLGLWEYRLNRPQAAALDITGSKVV